MAELEKFIDQANLPERLRPTLARYTGQEDQDKRDLIRQSKPDLLESVPLLQARTGLRRANLARHRKQHGHNLTATLRVRNSDARPESKQA